MTVSIIGIDSRCRHNTPIEIGKDGCSLCGWERDLLNRKLPFEVRYVGNAGLVKDNIYTVVGVILDGKMMDGGVIPGLILKAKGDPNSPVSATTKSYDPIWFSLNLKPPGENND